MFKVGDCVKIIGRSCIAARQYYHKCGIVTEVEYKYCILDIDTAKGGIWNTDLELVKFKTQAEKLRFEGKL